MSHFSRPPPNQQSSPSFPPVASTSSNSFSFNNYRPSTSTNSNPNNPDIKSKPSLQQQRSRNNNTNRNNHNNNFDNSNLDERDLGVGTGGGLNELRRQSNYSTLGLSPRRKSKGGSRKDNETMNNTNNKKGKQSRKSNLFNQSTSLTGESRVIDESMETSQSRVEQEEDLAEEEENQEEEEEEWGTIERMRNWRNDSMTQHLYGTAEFWGSKIFEMTGNPNDAFWLSQTLFYTHQYTQALKILSSSPSTFTSSTSNSTSNQSHSPTTTDNVVEGRKLIDTSLACRYLAAQSLVRLGKWEEGLEMVTLGESGSQRIFDEPRGSEKDRDEEDADEGDGGIKLRASMSHLKGLIHLHLGSTDLAKESFLEALVRDVKCFESFQILVGGEMMQNEEEWEFIQGLPFLAQTGDDAEFVRMMYTVRLKKMTHHEEMVIAREKLTLDFGLAEDPDVMFSLADELYTGLRFAECYNLTSKILAVHSSHRPTLPLHISCLHHLPNLRSKLFLLAHELVEIEPDDAISWYAVGLWYFSGKRWEESRRYFGKSVLIDSRFGPSWIAFAHSYAYEGEHDQAITAYSTSMRHFQSSHLPLLFIGMQHLGLSNSVLALEYLLASKQICEGADPLVWNELGVVALAEEEYEAGLRYLLTALRVSVRVQGSKSAWSVIHLNLGHAYRKLEQYEEAHASFSRVIALNAKSSAAYSGLGLVEHYLGHYQESIARYHEALSISPGDPVICKLLKLVLEDTDLQISSGLESFPGLPKFILRNIDDQVNLLDIEISQPRIKKRRKEVGIVEGNLEEEEKEEIEISVETSGMSEDIVLGDGREEEEEASEGETMDMTG